jgi:pyrroloquinoline-quinone synthase
MAAWSRAEFEARLREQGKDYHIHHPFNVMLAGGKAEPEQIRGWVANRFVYQVAIPRKDAAILANCPDRAVRRRWIQRLIDQDGGAEPGDGDHAPDRSAAGAHGANGAQGTQGAQGAQGALGAHGAHGAHGRDEGGIEAWIRLGIATGLTREEITDFRHALPAVRFAVDAYVDFARRAPWQEAVCASLTEMFAPQIHRQRLSTWPEHYPWIEPRGLQYFRDRVSRAGRDVEHGLALTLDHFDTRPLQLRALEVLKFKLDVLWAISDAIAARYGLYA